MREFGTLYSLLKGTSWGDLGLEAIVLGCFSTIRLGDPRSGVESFPGTAEHFAISVACLAFPLLMVQGSGGRRLLKKGLGLIGSSVTVSPRQPRSGWAWNWIGRQGPSVLRIAHTGPRARRHLQRELTPSSPDGFVTGGSS